jgi:hypothetical protein
MKASDKWLAVVNVTVKREDSYIVAYVGIRGRKTVSENYLTKIYFIPHYNKPCLCLNITRKWLSR